MERIKAAIAKAKKDQVNQPGAKRNIASSGPLGGKETPEQDPHAIENLEYKQTRIVELDNDLLASNRIIAYNKNNLLSGSFDLLRTQVLHKMEENGWKTIAITSPTPEAGKTVVSINLAMSIAQQTEKTAMLVDFDLKKPKIARYLGLDLDESINDVFENEKPVEEVLINPGIPRFVVLAAKKSMRNSSELLSSNKARTLIQDVKGRYKDRIVVFDLPPLLNTDDAIAVLPQIDCVLMVIANGMSTKQEIEDSMRYLPAANLLGVVLNKSEESTSSYYY